MLEGKKVLGIIPARQDSKRLPNKNILNLNGKPLIAWTIEAAKESGYIDRVIVSTDSSKIAEISKRLGAEVPFIRPKVFASDTATSIDVIMHTINFVKKNEGKVFDYIILLQPTSPLRTLEDIDKAFEMLDNSTKAIISVCEADHSPLWSNTIPDDLSMKNFIRPEINNMRSQDLPEYYRLNGAIYISEINYIINNNGFIGNETKALIMPPERSVDIDSEIDLIMAEIILKNESKNK